MSSLQKRSIWLMLIMLLLLLSVVSVSLGSKPIPLLETLRVLFTDADSPFRMIIQDLRLPRVTAAILVGAALAVSGTILQGIIRNPLAAPDLVGITGGASAAAVSFLVGTGGIFSIHWLPFVAIGGALLATFLNYLLAWKNGVSPFRLVLIGIGIATAMGAVTTFLLLVDEAYQASQILGWLTGTLYGTAWKHVIALLPWVLGFLLMTFFLSKELDMQALGDELAVGLGSPVQKSRLRLLLCSVALAGAAVGIAGGVAFIGLMAPHMARQLVDPVHRMLLPVSALMGAVLLLAADLIGRISFSPLDIPAGVFTAAIGAPFFLYLLFRKRS
ncbi:FecCD family ABC transporter permease [Brevibacillus migulae]|uniref:FecCD family ABC transporter permease n=1 Tax=Brevibacillus migulae TaxID=1644114 RepID=UPI00106E24B5|nr:iron ABC transporter permease [Brevibacillus migulae]